MSTPPVPLEVLQISERVELSIRIGESHYREFKSAVQGPPSNKIARDAKDVMVDIARTLVAFANADGGELLVGVEDDGEVTGTPYDADTLSLLKNAYRTHVHADTPLPIPMVGQVEVKSKKVLYFNITKGDQFVYMTSDGRCIKRSDLQSIPVSSEKIGAERLEVESRAWDRLLEPGLTLADLDMDLLREVSSQIAYGVTPEKCLQHLGLADFSAQGLRLKRAAALLFAKDVRNYHPGCFVRIMTVNGQEKRSGEAYNIIKDDIVAENVMRLVELAWDRLSYALTMHTSLSENARFQQSYMYPQIACREALINAIVHRNYAMQGRGIEVSIFKDRLEILSPGRLLSTVSLADIKLLKGVHESRNPLVARVLREVGYVREMGEGIRRIYDVMRTNALAEPELSSDDNNFLVTLFHRSMYDPKVKLWLSIFDDLKLTEAQNAVVALGYEGKEFSTQDIVDRLGLVDMDKVREILTPLRQLGVVETTKNDNIVFAEAKRHKLPKRSVPRWRIISDLQRRAAQKGTQEPIAEERAVRVIRVANLPYSLDRAAIAAALGEDVPVEALEVPSADLPERQNRGYCFVSVPREEASRVRASLEQMKLDGRQLRATLMRQS